MSTRVAPIFPVRDLDAALAYCRGLGFGMRAWRGGGYGFITFDEVARAWLMAGGEVRLPADTEWGQHEGVLIDPDGNVIRFGSPVPADHGAHQH